MNPVPILLLSVVYITISACRVTMYPTNTEPNIGLFSDIAWINIEKSFERDLTIAYNVTSVQPHS